MKERTAEEERAAIVAWLRKMAAADETVFGKVYATVVPIVVQPLAQAIEDGTHHEA